MHGMNNAKVILVFTFRRENIWWQYFIPEVMCSSSETFWSVFMTCALGPGQWQWMPVTRLVIICLFCPVLSAPPGSDSSCPRCLDPPRLRLRENKWRLSPEAGARIVSICVWWPDPVLSAPGPCCHVTPLMRSQQCKHSHRLTLYQVWGGH